MSKTNRKILVSCWHRGIIFYGYFFRGLMAGTIGSLSRDAEIAAAIFKRLGIKVFKGSSTRGGRAALDAIIEYINSDNYGGFNPDGPGGASIHLKTGYDTDRCQNRRTDHSFCLGCRTVMGI